MIIGRYSWSGTAYAWASDPNTDPTNICWSMPDYLNLFWWFTYMPQLQRWLNEEVLHPLFANIPRESQTTLCWSTYMERQQPPCSWDGAKSMGFPEESGATHQTRISSSFGIEALELIIYGKMRLSVIVAPITPRAHNLFFDAWRDCTPRLSDGKWGF